MCHNVRTPKSELLRTLVLGLAATHPPDVLNMVLVDFKGGATFAGMSRLGQVAAVITNLQDDEGLVARMHQALSGELNRRQELLRAAGNLVSVRDYERARQRGAALCLGQQRARVPARGVRLERGTLRQARRARAVRLAPGRRFTRRRARSHW